MPPRLINQSTTDSVTQPSNRINNKNKKHLTSPTKNFEQYTNYGCSLSTKSSVSTNFNFPNANKKRSNSTKSNNNLKNPNAIQHSKSMSSLQDTTNDSDIQFFVKMKKIKTYSVVYEENNCGLELYPFDTSKTTGAVVLKCHNMYSKENVIVNSLLIGINNEIVVNRNYAEILKTIMTVKRPLNLTFYPPPNCNADDDGENRKLFQNLTLWLEMDDSMRFKLKKLKE